MLATLRQLHSVSGSALGPLEKLVGAGFVALRSQGSGRSA
jgi:hypothetical protein